MPARRRSRTATLIAMLPALAGLLGCEAVIGLRPDRPGEDPGAAVVPVNPGRVALRRLNRDEYNRTVQALLETSLRPADAFPADDRDSGYDTLGSALSTTPLHVELYETAAWQLVEELFADASRRDRVLGCDVTANDTSCLRTALESFGLRAWRRPLSTAELDGLLTLANVAPMQGGTRAEGAQLALVAVLTSPFFVYRVERDGPAERDGSHRLNDYELATRLSYFVWSQPPDRDLLDAAAEGRLQADDGLLEQLDRLLDDPRSDALVDNFAGQWLSTRSLLAKEVDPAVFPEWSPALAASAKRETELFFREFLRNDRPISEMLTADFTFADALLGNFYGVQVRGTEFTRVSLSGTERRGLLGHASILVTTSSSDRTSPVKRGHWVLDHLMCDPPPPPPPGVEASLGDDAARAPATLRERLAQHREDPGCAGCHDRMDPIGLGLEGYDAIGRVRAGDVDVTGSLPGGTTFNGPRELAEILAEDPRFDTCVTEQLLRYGLGRRFEGSQDRAWIRTITQQARERGGTIRATLEAIVISKPFRYRRPEATL